MEFIRPFVRRDFTDCIHCGLCLEACPTYRETLEEGLSARGRIDLIRAFAAERIPPGGANPRSLDLCLACASCQAACPSGVAYLDLLTKARSWLPAARSERRERRVLRVLRLLFLRPRLLRLVLASVRLSARLGLAGFGVRLLFAKSHRSHLLDLVASLREEVSGAVARTGQSPRLSRRSPADHSRAVAGSAPPSRGTTSGVKASGGVPSAAASSAMVALFRGCTTPVLFPRVTRALESLLEGLGVGFEYPSGQGCCGALLLHHGDIESARSLARRNVAAFDSSAEDPILVEAAGCGAVLKSYGDLLADDPEFADRARRFSSRVQDATEYLAAQLPKPLTARQSAPRAPTQSSSEEVSLLAVYQDPCHLRHLQGVADAPRDLLDWLPGIRRVSAEEEDLCCGSAGIYNLLEPEMSARLAARKVACLTATGAQIVVTANPGCRIQLAGRLRRAGLPMLHLIELCAQRWPCAAVRACAEPIQEESHHDGVREDGV